MEVRTAYICKLGNTGSQRQYDIIKLKGTKQERDQVDTGKRISRLEQAINCVSREVGGECWFGFKSSGGRGGGSVKFMLFGIDSPNPYYVPLRTFLPFLTFNRFPAC
jgi:hypothetical protein